MNEKDIIAKYFSPNLNDFSIVKGVGDDAAILSPSSEHQLVVTTDALVENTHFVKNAPAYYVGYKLMAVNLSDIAAMGAKPRWATLNLTLVDVDAIWLQEFSKGLLDCANKFNVTLVGGDTTHGEQLNVSVQLIGEVPTSQALRRDHAKANDRIFVTGKLGSAASALIHLQKNNNSHKNLSETQLSSLYQPEPRVELAMALREFCNSAIDISDGFLNELDIICHASNVGAKVSLEKLSVDTNIEIEQAITAGEDYELLFTARAEFAPRIMDLAKTYNCHINEVGKICNTHAVELFYNDQVFERPTLAGYDHFENPEL